MATSVTSSPTQTRPIDPDKLNALLGQAVQDMGAAMHAPLIVIGDKLGLYRAMGDGSPVTPAELASRTGTAERYIREWLNANAASKFVEYDASSRKYFMSPEQALALAQDDTAVHLPGFYHMLASLMKDKRRRSRRSTARAKAWVGMSMRRACSKVANDSFGQPILRT